MLEDFKARNNVAALVVDMQPDFYSSGALPVTGGEEIVPGIAEALQDFETIVFTQDSHPNKHISFASSYAGKKPFEVLRLESLAGLKSAHFSLETLEQYLRLVPEHQQSLWPDHCIVGTPGWELDRRLPVDRASMILRKGQRAAVDSYSAFHENDGSPTGLADFLKARSIDSLFVCGLAGDYCVFWSIEDAIRSGFRVYLDLNLTRFVDFPSGQKTRAVESMKERGVIFL